MRKALVLLIWMAMILALLAGAALSARGPIWQTSVSAVDGGFELGLRDKEGDMAQGYTLLFVVKAPNGQEYRTQRAVKARHDQFVEVVFPRDFQGTLTTGVYICKFVIGAKTVVSEKFTYQIVGGRGVIQNRQWL